MFRLVSVTYASCQSSLNLIHLLHFSVVHKCAPNKHFLVVSCSYTLVVMRSRCRAVLLYAQCTWLAMDSLWWKLACEDGAGPGDRGTITTLKGRSSDTVNNLKNRKVHFRFTERVKSSFGLMVPKHPTGHVRLFCCSCSFSFQTPPSSLGF